MPLEAVLAAQYSYAARQKQLDKFISMLKDGIGECIDQGLNKYSERSVSAVFRQNPEFRSQVAKYYKNLGYRVEYDEVMITLEW